MRIKPISILILCLSFSAQVSPGGTILQELSDGFDYRVNQLFYLTRQEPADNSRNPGNSIFRIPRYEAAVELRPDFSLFFKNFSLSAKPRLTWQWTSWKEGCCREETEKDWDLFVNEWLLRIQINDRLFGSYGRENLQWGPGWLFSPSNPFFRDNGRSNPKIETPGIDFARLVYLPNTVWTLSLIGNLDKGRRVLEIDEKFNKTYALKLDFTGEETYAGLLLSQRESDISSLGGFGGWTFSDAMLLYTDFSISETADKPDLPQFAVLAGASYTLETGPTFAVEYAHQKNGPGFSRRNNVMLQYSQNEILDILNIVFRVTENMDDDSAQSILILEYLSGEHTQMFINSTINFGAENKEFGGILDFHIMAGLEYSF